MAYIRHHFPLVSSSRTVHRLCAAILLLAVIDDAAPAAPVTYSLVLLHPFLDSRRRFSLVIGLKAHRIGFRTNSPCCVAQWLLLAGDRAISSRYTESK